MSHQELLHEYREALADWRGPGSPVAGIEIRSGQHGCATCRAISGQYRLDCAPALPDRCENLFGCAVAWRPLKLKPQAPAPKPPTSEEIKAIERMLWFNEQLETAYQMLHALHSRKTFPSFRAGFRQTLKTVLWEMEVACPQHPAIPLIREAFDILTPKPRTEWKRPLEAA